MPGSRLSKTEKTLEEIWAGSPSVLHPSLLALSIKGNPGLRGITEIDLEFRYPVTVVCGRNGVGKSTLLALTSLAFQPPSGHIPLNAKLAQRGSKKYAHYTFADFFFKGPQDADVSGVEIEWRFSGAVRSKRITKQSEKWMRYETRPIRPMHFIGLARAMHPIEQRTLRGHKDSSAQRSSHALSKNMLARFSEIIGKRYDEAASLVSNQYSRLRTCRAGSPYSGFNMGSGEDIILGILTTIDHTPEGSLIIIEELEVGLYQQAQELLVQHLIELALEKKLQIILSSHSEVVIDRVPRAARVLVQAGVDGKRNVVYAPTTRMALGNMFGAPQSELTIVCEDDFSAVLTREMLRHDLRKRVCIQPIGSCSEIGKAGAYAHQIDGQTRLLLAWDGDVSESNIKNWLLEDCCKRVFNNDASKRRVQLCKLPGPASPERIAIAGLDTETGPSVLANELRCELNDAVAIITQLTSMVDDHDIPYQFSRLSGCHSQESATEALCRAFARSTHSGIETLNQIVESVLAGSDSPSCIAWNKVYS